MIYVRRREAWYWFAVCITFATGTALGDMMSITAGLGQWQSCLFFFGLFLCAPIVWYFQPLYHIACFWWAYVMTRPIGTNLGDFLSAYFSDPGYVALIFGIPLLVGVVFLEITKYDTNFELEFQLANNTEEKSKTRGTNETIGM